MLILLETLLLMYLLVLEEFFIRVFLCELEILPWSLDSCLALGFGDLLGDCVSWIEDLSLVLCIVY